MAHILFDQKYLEPDIQDTKHPSPQRARACYLPSSPVDTYNEEDKRIFLQPETRSMTPEQLVNEVKGIYAGLVMVEKKCVEIHQQRAATTKELTNEQWQALIAVHRTLLHEHHDFFLASQHPSSSKASVPYDAQLQAIPEKLRTSTGQITASAEQETSRSVNIPSLGTLDTASPATVEIYRRKPSETQLQHRRGRGKRKNEGYWKDFNSRDDTDPFDGRECLFSDEKGKVRTPGMANLDTGLKVPGGLIMSSQYAEELGRYQDISQDFVDPCLRSISGHMTPVTGVLRNVVFRLKGTSVTFKRDFFVCDAIDGMVDIMFGASFIKNQFKLLFERVKECISTFATWFSTKKESMEEKAERERRERDQRIKATQREIARLQKEEQMLRAAQRQRQEGAGNP